MPFKKPRKNIRKIQRNGNSEVAKAERMVLGLCCYRYRNKATEEIKEPRKDEGKACQYASEEINRKLMVPR